MSDSPAGDSSERDAVESASILAALPSTRPQRASARRAAARARATGAAGDGAPRAKRSASRKAAGGSPEHDARGAPAKPGGARRAAAKPPADGARRAKPKSPRHGGARADSARPQAKRRASAAGVKSEPAPRQGYEIESDSLAGPVEPPGSAELVASASELAGELAKAGVSAGARLIKDLFSRLPG